VRWLCAQKGVALVDRTFWAYEYLCGVHAAATLCIAFLRCTLRVKISLTLRELKNFLRRLAENKYSHGPFISQILCLVTHTYAFGPCGMAPLLLYASRFKRVGIVIESTGAVAGSNLDTRCVAVVEIFTSAIVGKCTTATTPLHSLPAGSCVITGHKTHGVISASC